MPCLTLMTRSRCSRRGAGVSQETVTPGPKRPQTWASPGAPFRPCNPRGPRRASQGSSRKNAAPRALRHSPMPSWASSARRARLGPAPRRLPWLDGCTRTAGAASLPGAWQRPSPAKQKPGRPDPHDAYPRLQARPGEGRCNPPSGAPLGR